MIYALLAYILVRELIFWVNHHKMINKLMSRDFYSYQMAEQYKPREKKPVKVEQGRSMNELDSLKELTF